MTKIVVNTIRSQTGVTSVTFHDTITANGKKQWLDRLELSKQTAQKLMKMLLSHQVQMDYQLAQSELVQDILSQFKVIGG